jgi:serine/threonine protein kinase
MERKRIIDKKILVHDLCCVAKLPIEKLKELIFDVYILSDNVKKVIYIKSRPVEINSYFIDKMCGKDVTITKIKSIYMWELKDFVSRQDAVLIEAHKSIIPYFDGGLLVPSRVRQVLEIDKPIKDAIKLDRTELKKVYKYSYEISHDSEALKFYYEKMHSPHIKRKYGKVADFIYFKKFFRNGELVFVKLNGERVSAAMNMIDKDCYHLHSNGVINENFVKEGAILATYYFSVLRAKDVNAKLVDFGLSKPFLSDGVLRHKNQWGTKICEYDTAIRFIYVKNILFGQPFIYLDNGKLKATIFSENDKFKKEYANAGLEFNIIQTINKQL